MGKFSEWVKQRDENYRMSELDPEVAFHQGQGWWKGAPDEEAIRDFVMQQPPGYDPLQGISNMVANQQIPHIKKALMGMGLYNPKDRDAYIRWRKGRGDRFLQQLAAEKQARRGAI